jgi:hypothetical protein
VHYYITMPLASQVHYHLTGTGPNKQQPTVR